MIGKVRSEEANNRIQFVVGVLAMLVCGAVVAAAGFLYLFPVGVREYKMREYVTGGLKPGDFVRVAGVDVGEVKSVGLEGDHVLVKFTVRDSIQVGDESSTEVRLLTPVGGHFLSLSLKGKEPLGDKAIPVEHSHSPFDEFESGAPRDPLQERKPWEVLDVVEQANNTTKKINVNSLHTIMAELTKALDAQPDVIRTTIEAVVKFVDLIAERQEQLRQAVGVAHEYVHEFGMEKELFSTLLNRLARLAQVLDRWKADFPEILDQLGWFVKFLQRPLYALENRLATPIGDIEDLLENLVRHPINPVDTIRQIIDSIFRGAGVLYDHEPRRVGPENRNACIRAGREDC